MLQGDISKLPERGHFYFAPTLKRKPCSGNLEMSPLGKIEMSPFGLGESSL